MNIDAYLARIGLDHRPPPTLAGRTEVHRAHMLAVPYENLDVQLGRPVTIARPAIYEKIVNRRRGGWCYEMNGILGWALGELGFRATRATGAVMREAAGAAVEANHLVLKVELEEGTYLADVGFGDGPLEPIRVVPGDFASNGYVFNLSRADGAWWRMRSHPNGAAPSFDFHLDPADETRLAARCAELQTAPDSHFVLNLFCFAHRPGGTVRLLRGRVLRTITPAGYTDRVLENADDLVATLREDFRLDVPETATLWPKIVARHEQVLGQEAAAP
ncbi:MAG: arylamine N-acetyltransferase [Rhizomicrobium sp.]